MNQSFTSFPDFKRRYPIRPNDESSLLGSGSYGRVFKVEDQLETEWVAIKISEFKGNEAKSLKAEVDLAQRVPRQANIARYDACYRLETDTSVSDFAIMKYYPDGNLADLLQHNSLTIPQIYDITQGILLGLQHLHRHRIVHRDFKPANILISRDNAGRFIPKIADFGLSKLVTSDELDNSDFDLSDGRGTPSYKAPEQIEGSRVSFNLDLWAFGVILYEILTGEKPFRADLRNSSEQSARREIEKKIITVTLPERINQVAEPYATMIRRCLVRDIHERVRREDELLDLLDEIPTLLADARKLVSQHRYEQAISLFGQILIKREHHTEAKKELAQCQLDLKRQQLSQLLAKANDHVTRRQFEQAKSYFEQALQIDPTHSTAIQGLAQCVNELRPQPAVISKGHVSDKTDVYEERTDVYQPPIKPAAIQNRPVHTKTTTSAAIQKTSASSTIEKAVISQPIKAAVTRTIPWRILAPVAIGLGGLILYYQLGSEPVKPSTNKDPNVVATEQKAEIMPALSLKAGPKATTPKPTNVTKPDPTPPVAVALNTNSINRRIDVAMDKARLAYEQKDYALAIVLCKSALQLDPARPDVIGFLNSSIKASQRSAGGTPPVVALKEPVRTAEPTKVAAPVVDEKEKASKEKQEAQAAYDQLIEEGIKAISSGNNKVKAIAEFGKASSLAKELNLNTTKSEGAYTTYLTKANRIFDSEEYDGAKGWYKVAQALKDTPEVRARIKQCTNQ